MPLWPDWRSVLLIVQPETVIRWHRQGFRLYWRWKSRACKPGRQAIDAEVRTLIRRMSKENPSWGAPRIQSELKLLGHDLAAIDFFTVPAATALSATLRFAVSLSTAFQWARLVISGNTPSLATTTREVLLLRHDTLLCWLNSSHQIKQLECP